MINLVCRKAFENDVLRLDLLYETENFCIGRLVSALHHVFLRDEKVGLQGLALFEDQTGHPDEIRVKFTQVSFMPLFEVGFPLLEYYFGLPAEL